MRSPFEATGINMDSPTSEAFKPELFLCVYARSALTVCPSAERD